MQVKPPLQVPLTPGSSETAEQPELHPEVVSKVKTKLKLHFGGTGGAGVGGAITGEGQLAEAQKA
jgi:hypothetical protein